jgi:hypothetical protein
MMGSASCERQLLKGNEMLTGMTTPHCGYCGRPVIGPAIYAGGLAYHSECTRGPGGPQIYQAPPLTAEMVRQIVREELAQHMGPNQ